MGLMSVSVALLALLAVKARTADPPAGGTVEILFVYGSEKKHWIDEVTKDFHAGNPTIDGRPIHVKTVPLGSGETVEDVLSGKLKAHLISPASGAYLDLGNAMAHDAGQKDLIDSKRQNLVLSPVVIAMWKPMAEALGWPTKPIGWKELRELAVSEKGWGLVGHPEWGPFKFGHTHPERSNSGLTALFAQVYAATGKKNLTVADVESPATGEFLKDMQSAVVHYGSSTGFFADELFGNGMDNLSAAVLYESVVVDSCDPKTNKFRSQMPADVVAIYPKEGTLLSDHPVALVDRPWCAKGKKPEDDSPERKAAKKYIAFLLEEPQQKKALKYGFRPGDENIDLGAPIDAAHGVNKDQPGANVLRAPEVDVMRACLKAWAKYKKHAKIVLVFDKSGSMKWESGKLESAKEGAKEIVKQLGDDDSLALLVFNHKLNWVNWGEKIKGNRARLEEQIDKIDADGMTSLYGAISEAHRLLEVWRDPSVITAVVVLTDGTEDLGEKLPNGEADPVPGQRRLANLLRQVAVDNKTKVTRIYTIAYGSDADEKVLAEIAKITKAKAYKGKPDTIKGVVRDIATFF
jgi:Ca-activated chloride channel family protein